MQITSIESPPLIFSILFRVFVSLVVFAYSNYALASPATVLKIEVYPEKAGLSSLPECRVDVVTDCVSTLAGAFELIQTPQWQDKLPEGLSLVSLKLAAGKYRLTNPLSLRWGDGKNIALEIAGDRRQSVISGGARIESWSRLSNVDRTTRINENVASNIWTADISQHKLPLNQIPQSKGYGLPIRPVLTELYADDVVQPVAGWPNNGFGALIRPSGLPTEDNRTFSIVDKKVSDWASEPDLQVQAFWRWDWAWQSHLVSQKEVAKNQLVLFGSGSPYGIKFGQRVRVVNALIELDAPGEWYVNRISGTLFFYPNGKEPPRNTEIAVASGLLQIDRSKNVSLRDIRFEKSRGDAIHVAESDAIVFDNVIIRHTGNRALVVNKCTNSGVRNSIIEENGEGGVFLSGGDRPTLSPALNFVENSQIRAFSRLIKTMRFAVELDGVGNSVKNNIISDSPHTAIFFSGNYHLISGNEIFNVVTEAGDSGAIYVGRDYAAQGNVIEGNFFHDIQPRINGLEVKGVYIDDQASGITVKNNTFARVQQPVFISGGRDNKISNNIFFESSPAVHLDARGVEAQRDMTNDQNGTLQKRLDSVPYKGALWASRFPTLPQIRIDSFGMPKYNTFINNTVIGGQVSRVSDTAKPGIALINNNVGDESLFVEQMPRSSRKKKADFLLRNIPLK